MGSRYILTAVWGCGAPAHYRKLGPSWSAGCLGGIIGRLVGIGSPESVIRRGFLRPRLAARAVAAPGRCGFQFRLVSAQHSFFDFLPHTIVDGMCDILMRTIASLA